MDKQESKEAREKVLRQRQEEEEEWQRRRKRLATQTLAQRVDSADQDLSFVVIAGALTADLIAGCKPMTCSSVSKQKQQHDRDLEDWHQVQITSSCRNLASHFPYNHAVWTSFLPPSDACETSI